MPSSPSSMLAGRQVKSIVEFCSPGRLPDNRCECASACFSGPGNSNESTKVQIGSSLLSGSSRQVKLGPQISLTGPPGWLPGGTNKLPPAGYLSSGVLWVGSLAPRGGWSSSSSWFGLSRPPTKWRPASQPASQSVSQPANQSAVSRSGRQPNELSPVASKRLLNMRKDARA